MKQYFEIIFTSTNEKLYVTASSMDRVALWVLQNRPMSDYYGMNIIQVNSDKTRPASGDFMCNAVREYYHYDTVYGDMSDEEIRQAEIKRYIDYIKNGHKIIEEDWY